MLSSVLDVARNLELPLVDCSYNRGCDCMIKVSYFVAAGIIVDGAAAAAAAARASISSKKRRVDDGRRMI